MTTTVTTATATAYTLAVTVDGVDDGLRLLILCVLVGGPLYFKWGSAMQYLPVLALHGESHSLQIAAGGKSCHFQS